MKFKDFSYLAFKALLTNRSRAILTTLGITIGIGSVVLMTSLGSSAELLILNEVTSTGSNAIFIEPGPGDSVSLATISEIKKMKMADVEALKRLPVTEIVLPYAIKMGALAQAGDEDMRADVSGTTPEVQRYENSTVANGRFFTEGEVKAAARLVVLGEKVAANLFPDQDPVGRRIRIDQKAFEVIGVMAKQGTKFFQDYDKYVYMPVTTAQTYLLGVTHINYIGVLITGDLDLAVNEIRQAMRVQHNIDNPADDLGLDDFRVHTQAEAVKILSTVSSALTIFLAAIAAISLVVGGIGIMNISLVSVTERTKEIGLRKAVGATKKQILYQFLLEAVTLTTTGGILGLLLGIGLAVLAKYIVNNYLSGWEFSLPLQSVLLALGVAFTTGLVFGIYPAKRAADLNPIEALRHE